jgi:hypothetical protein
MGIGRFATTKAIAFFGSRLATPLELKEMLHQLNGSGN